MLGDFGQDLLGGETRVAVAERVILVTAVVAVLLVGRSCQEHSGINEDADGHRQFTFVNQVVENDRGAPTAGFRDHPAAVLKDHHASGLLRAVLRWNVDPIVANRARIDLAGPGLLRDCAPGNARFSLRIRAEDVILPAEVGR